MIIGLFIAWPEWLFSAEALAAFGQAQKYCQSEERAEVVHRANGLKRNLHQPPHQPHGQPQQLERNGPTWAEKGAAGRFTPLAAGVALAPELVYRLGVVTYHLVVFGIGAGIAKKDVTLAALGAFHGVGAE